MRVPYFLVSPRSGEMSRPNFEHCPEAIQVDAVDRSKFRTCDQGSFCRRPAGDVMTRGKQDTRTPKLSKYGTDGYGPGRYKKWISRPEREKALWTLLPQTRTTAVELCTVEAFFIFPTYTSRHPVPSARSPLPEGGFSFQVKHVNEAK